MIYVPSCIFERSGNIIVLQIWKIRNDLCTRRAASQQVQYVGHTDTLPAYTGPPAEDFRIEGNAIEMIAHTFFLQAATSRIE
jgi:hypothetical protein